MVHHQQTKKNKKKSKLIFILLKAPFTLLAAARDFYVQGITNCSGRRASYGPTRRPNGLPNSPSLTSSRFSSTKSFNEDFRELVRAASARTLMESNIERYINGRKSMMKKFVIGVETIDEEKECEFGDPEVRVCKRASTLR